MNKIKALMLIGFFFASVSGNAATITVTNLGDAGAGSLRAAITTAETDVTADTIEFGVLTGTINLSSALPDITRPLTITGNGNVTIAGGGPASGFRIFNINVGGGGARTAVSLQSLTIIDGEVLSVPQNGGAVLARGNVSLSISSCTFTSNAAVAGGALAILNNAQVSITGGTFQSNIAGSAIVSGSGGAIFLGDGGQLDMKRVSFVRNRAFNQGGALAMDTTDGTATATVLTSLFLQNDSGTGGGAVAVVDGGNTATLNLQRVTIFGNDGDRGGVVPAGAGGILTSGSTTVNLRNSLLALNGKNRSAGSADAFTGGTDNCEGTITSQGQNLSDIADTACGLGSSDFSAATSGINYTATMTEISLGTSVLLSTSQAIDHGNSSFCTGTADLNIDLNSKASYGVCDVGAFEFGSCGDSFVQTGAGEQCDPVSSTCDSSCQNISSSGGSGGGGASSGSGGAGGTGGASGIGGTGGTGGTAETSNGGCSLLIL